MSEPNTPDPALELLTRIHNSDGDRAIEHIKAFRKQARAELLREVVAYVKEQIEGTDGYSLDELVEHKFEGVL